VSCQPLLSGDCGGYQDTKGSRTAPVDLFACIPEIHLLADLAVGCQNPENLSTGLEAPAPKIAEIAATPTNTVRWRAEKSYAGTRRR
jgi:hypothetical protein